MFIFHIYSTFLRNKFESNDTYWYKPPFKKAHLYFLFILNSIQLRLTVNTDYSLYDLIIYTFIKVFMKYTHLLMYIVRALKFIITDESWFEIIFFKKYE